MERRSQQSHVSSTLPLLMEKKEPEDEAMGVDKKEEGEELEEESKEEMEEPPTTRAIEYSTILVHHLGLLFLMSYN